MSPETAECYRHHVEEILTPAQEHDEGAILSAANAALDLLTPGEEKALRLKFGMQENFAFQDVRLQSWRAAIRKLRRVLRTRNLG